MKNEIMVTVLMLCYNHERYIRQALDGVINQATTFPFEIIVHDDASTDRSAEIIGEYAEEYPDLIVPIFQKENQYSKRVNITRTYLYPKIRGKYIAACECDDFWCDSNKLQKQVEFLENHEEYVATAHNCYFVNEDNQKIENIYSIYRPYRNHCYTLKRFALDTVYPGQTATIVYRKTAMDFATEAECDAFYGMRLKTGDKRRNLKLLLTGDFYCFEDFMSAYRIVTHGGDSWTARNYGRNMSDLLHIASIDMRKFAKKCYNRNLFNYYTTFHTGVAGILKFILKPNEQNREVCQNIVKEHHGVFLTLLYLAGLGIISIPLYIMREIDRRKYDLKDSPENEKR